MKKQIFSELGKMFSYSEKPDPSSALSVSLVKPIFDKPNIRISDLRKTTLVTFPNWCVQVRVTKIHNTYSWIDEIKGACKVFSFIVTDGSSEIEVKAFTPEYDMFFHMVIEDQVYLLGNAGIKDVDQRFKKTDHTFEILLRPNSVFIRCENDVHIPAMFCQLLSIAEAKKRLNERVNVLGMCQHVGDIVRVGSCDDKKYVKKVIQIVDESQERISVCFWRSEAEKFSCTVQSVILLKSVLVTSFGLSVGCNSFVQIDPHLAAADSLKEWYKSYTDKVKQLPENELSFCSLSEISNLDDKTVVNVLAICKHVGEVTKCETRNSIGKVSRRDIILIDLTEVNVCLVLWSSTAEQFRGKRGTVLLLKKCFVNSFNGLSSNTRTIFTYDPISDLSKELNSWFNVFQESEFTSISDMKTLGSNDFRDILAICKDVCPMREIVNNSTGNVLLRRVVVLFDASEDVI